MTGDGRVPEWAYRSRDNLRSAIERATFGHAKAKAVLSNAQLSAQAARNSLEKTSLVTIEAPPNSLVRSVFANNDKAVEAGTKIV